VFTIGDGDQVVVDRGRRVTRTSQGDLSRVEIGELLDQAEAVFRADTNLTDNERQDGLADVASMRSQLTKATPNRRALVALAGGLPPIAALADIARRAARARRLNAAAPG
jgi:hypothetical protein